MQYTFNRPLSYFSIGTILISLTGCAEVNYEVEINKDGSGEIIYIYGVSKEKIGGSADLVEQFVETMQEQAEESGYNVELYENEEISGFKDGGKAR